jgi:hypothetical protein
MYSFPDICHQKPRKQHFSRRIPLQKVGNGMKGVFECFSRKYGGSYKVLISMARMIETSAASHMFLKFLLNGSLTENRLKNRYLPI